MIIELPYPISANVYWRTATVCGRAQTYVSKEAKQYKIDVAWLAKKAGIRAPLAGRIALSYVLYPQRPQDWLKRSQKNPATWDDDVRCMDLDNAQKVLIDAMKDIVFGDDKMIRRIHGERAEPDDRGARVVVTVEQILSPGPQRVIDLNVIGMPKDLGIDAILRGNPF